MSEISDVGTNKSPLIHILTWFLFLVGVFSLCARIGSKLFMSARITWDDRLALASQAILLFQSIVLSVGAVNGLGKPVHSLPEQSQRRALKAEYAYISLFLLALALSKLSLCCFIEQLTPGRIHRRLNLTMCLVITPWLVSSVLVSLFECSLPTPWDILDHKKCVNRLAWWTYVVVLNIATEFGFVWIYFTIFKGLQTSLARKISVLGIFSTRLLVAGAATIQLVMFTRSMPKSNGGSYNGWAPVIGNQIVAALSVVTSCIPYLKPFMQSIELGVIQVNENGSQEELSQRQTTAPRNTQGGSGLSGNSGKSKRPGEGTGFFSQLSQISPPTVVRPSSPGPEDRW